MSQNSPHIQDHPEQIYTVANVITVVRLLLVPFAFSVLVSRDNDTLAFVLFALAGASDFVDGQIARRTHTVTEIGKIIDPLVDRFLIAAGVVGLYAVHRLPLWVLVVLIGRDVFLLSGMARLRKLGVHRVDVLFIGKLTTILLLFGFSGLILNWPVQPGLSMTSLSAFPGFTSAPVSVWIWFVYGGLLCSVVTAISYVVVAWRLVYKDK